LELKLENLESLLAHYQWENDNGRVVPRSDVDKLTREKTKQQLQTIHGKKRTKGNNTITSVSAPTTSTKGKRNNNTTNQQVISDDEHD
jgi:hypothetical protein